MTLREPNWTDQAKPKWPVTALRRLARLESGHTPSRQHEEYWRPAECTIPWFGLSDVWQLREGRQKVLGETSEKISALGMANSAARLLPAGTVVLSRTASVGFSGVMPIPMATTQDFANWVPGPSLSSDYLYWSFQAMAPEFERIRMGSTHKTIYMPDIKRLRIVHPPLGAQRAIADFLDRKTAAIDALIDKKERLLALLQEKRQALITQAVTKGLDPNVPMKDSGIEWLGGIPAHWEVLQLRREITLQRGVDITKDVQRDGAVPVVTSGGVSSFHDTALMKGPGVVIGRKGSAGTVHWVDADYWPHDTTLYVKHFGDNDRRFVYYKMLSLRLDSFDTGAANPTLNRNLIHPLHVSWPPLDEQRRVVVLLDYRLHAMDALRSTHLLSIDRLREYRQALITAAVTGQLEVTSESNA